MRSSLAAFNLIVAEEVSSKEIYNKKYRRPEWPGEQSGATIGIGYDLGQTPRATVIADWKGRVPPAMLDAMVTACGRTGENGKIAMQSIRNLVDIPWETALAVHKECVIPRWEARVAAALPNTDKLPADCFGALLSLTFNRGPSFGKAGERFREMRAIKAHMTDEDFSAIPNEFRSMKRLWTLTGLRRRRDNEAALFERGLASMRLASSSPADAPEPEDKPLVAKPADRPAPHMAEHEEHEEPDLPDANEAKEPVAEDATVLFVQKRLRELGYFEVGEPDGGVNGMARTEGAILTFRNDNGLPLSPTIDDALLSGLAKAEPRKVSKSRANATIKDLRANGSKTIGTMDRIKNWVGGLFGVSAVAGAVDAGGDQMDAVTDGAMKLGQFKSAISGLGLGLGAIVIFMGAAVVIWFFAHRAQKNRVAEYQMGKNT